MILQYISCPLLFLKPPTIFCRFFAFLKSRSHKLSSIKRDLKIMQEKQMVLFVFHKAYLVCAFGMEACKQRYKTRYVRLPNLLLELEIARNDGTYKKVQGKYANPVVLIIDEWLLLKPTKSEKHDILEFLHRRRRKSSTIFCSQYDPSRWYDQLGGDNIPLSEAILNRIKHDAYKINIVPTDPANYRSIREVYGLDPALSE